MTRMTDADRYLNVVDGEATCWSDQPPAGMVNEIIEVGLTVVDLMEVAGLPLEGRHHRGDDDAWNIAALVLDLHTRGQRAS
jgi:inhibitor of KinA sporulation pathway (predicted exonuclease)